MPSTLSYSLKDLNLMEHQVRDAAFYGLHKALLAHLDEEIAFVDRQLSGAKHRFADIVIRHGGSLPSPSENAEAFTEGTRLMSQVFSYESRLESVKDIRETVFRNNQPTSFRRES